MVHFFYKNTLYKNSEPQVFPKNKNISNAYNGQKIKVFLFLIHEAYMKMAVLILFCLKAYVRKMFLYIFLICLSQTIDL